MLLSRSRPTLDELAWNLADLDDGLALLAMRAHFLNEDRPIPAPPPFIGQSIDLQNWLDVIAGQLEIELEPVETPYAQLDRLIQRSAPAVVMLEGGDQPRFLLLLRGGSPTVRVLGADKRRHRVAADAITERLRLRAEAPAAADADALLQRAGIAPERQSTARRALLSEQLAADPIGGVWLMRLLPGRPFLRYARHLKLWRPVLFILGGYTLNQAFYVLSWVILGAMALANRFDPAIVGLWALLLLSGIPFLMAFIYYQSVLAVGLGGYFKQRMLFGALQLEPDEIRAEGAGQFLSRVQESQAVENLAFTGGFTAVVAAIQLGVAMSILARGIGGAAHAGLLAAWALIALLLTARLTLHSRRWVIAYRTLTNDLIERMVGQRTRLAQENRATWHQDEDDLLRIYYAVSQRVDRSIAYLQAFMELGWYLIGFGAIAIPVLSAAPDATNQVAISIAGIVLAAQTLAITVNGAASIASAIIGWDQTRPLFRAATRTQSLQNPQALVALQRQRPSDGSEALLIARDINFRYYQTGQQILAGIRATVQRGDRILLQGSSGGGKSTLAAVLAALRRPETGLLLLEGVDARTLGADGWRKRVVLAPQFHENHIFSATLAFNLLMGRNWPPTAQDLDEARVICMELGLGDLLERMPLGLQQIVGETGWQLSHGERSRIYLARALLQQPALLILDESFGALDPQNRQIALETALRRAPALLVIAHP